MIKTSDRNLWRPAGSVVYSDLDEGVALLETSRNVYYSLAGSGEFLWRALLNGADFPTLCSALTDTFEVSPEIARADVAEWLEEMSAAGLIEEREHV
jgi:hypothetical protein